MAPDTPNPNNLNTYFIFEPTDDTATVWKHVGTVTAGRRSAAKNKFYDGRREPVVCSVLTDAEWKPETYTPQIVVSSRSEPFQMPTVHPGQVTITEALEDENADEPPDAPAA